MSLPLRALLYRRTSEPSAIPIAFEREVYLVRVRRHAPGAPLHAAHPCRHPRGGAHHAAARQPEGGARLRRKARRLDRGAARPPAAAGALRPRHAGCRCAASSTASCTGAASRGTVWIENGAADEPLLCVAGAAPHHRPPHPRLPQARGQARPGSGEPRRRRAARRCHQAGLDPRPVEPLGLLLDHRRAVLFLAADPGAALRARLSRRPRGRPSGRDEPLAPILAAGRAHLPACRRAPRPGSMRMAAICIATARPRTGSASVTPRHAVVTGHGRAKSAKRCLRV